MEYSFDGTSGYRTPTDVAGLDVQLGGGVPPETIMLLLAEPGASSEIFPQQFVYGGLSEGEEVYYFSSKQPINEIIDNLKNFGWNLEEYIDNSQLDFIYAYSLRFYNVLPKHLSIDLSAKDFIKQNIDAMNLLNSVVNEPRKEKYRGVIDSMSFQARPFHTISLTRELNLKPQQESFN